MGNRWGNNENSVRLILGGSKITADGDCSHEIKRRLLLGRKVMTNLDKIFKSRDITLPTPIPLATSCEGLTHWKRLQCWEGLGTGGEGTTEDVMAGWHHGPDRHESE